MRLIDADALPKTPYMGEDGETHYMVTAEDIANAPTIDAVPHEEHVKALNDLAVAWRNKFTEAEDKTAKLYDDTLRKVAEECKRCKARLANINPAPPTDLISRADAIEAVEKEYQFQNDRAIPYESYDNGMLHGLKKSADIISALPSADAVQGWITDRNPTEYGTYIVTITDENDSFVCLLHYGEPLVPICKVNVPCWYDSDAEFGDCPYSDILAWMPLPKPYKGGDTE